MPDEFCRAFFKMICKKTFECYFHPISFSNSSDVKMFPVARLLDNWISIKSFTSSFQLSKAIFQSLVVSRTHVVFLQKNVAVSYRASSLHIISITTYINDVRDIFKDCIILPYYGYHSCSCYKTNLPVLSCKNWHIQTISLVSIIFYHSSSTTTTYKIYKKTEKLLRYIWK